jgi:hypothetical protein
MLPFGHLAAGYLLSEGYLTLVRPAVSSSEAPRLAALGVFSSFAPDLDMFVAFYKEKKFIHTGAKKDHRFYLSHAPLLWLVFGLTVALMGRNVFWHHAGALIIIGSWSHFLLDSTDVGVRWLYPFNQRFFALKNPGQPEINNVRGFWPHWVNLLKMYWRRTPFTVGLEIGLVVFAVLAWAYLTKNI